jgi:gliding motility-associated-like protein
MRFYFFAFAVIFSFALQAQPTQSGLIAHYNFDNDACEPRDVTGNAANEGILNADTSICNCGISGGAMLFDGVSDYYTIAGSSVLDLFDTEDFTLSFYLKSPPDETTIANQVLFSKKSDDCAFTNSFEITYQPNSKFIEVLLQEDENVDGNVKGFVDFLTCWHLVTVRRKGLKTSLFINGELKDETTASKRVDLSNDNVLTVGKAHCGLFDVNFTGLLDDIRFYNRALENSEITELYYFPDRIANASFTRDTLIFKGSSVPVYLTDMCIESYNWEPAEQVCEGCTAVTDAEPDLFPQETTTFTLTMTDSLGCEALDTIRVTVIDPDTLDCTVAFMPKAFTPNFDGLNDTYGIDNSLVIDELITLEIFDRWGERIFFTNNASDRWDGSYKGKEMNAGVYLYKVEFVCDGTTRNKTDSFSIIR